MFQALNKIKIYEEALAKLSHPECVDKEIWLHDYKERCYRQDSGYTLNGLHWGYPDSLTDFVTGKCVEGARSFYYAAFVTEETLKLDYASNSRFSRVSYQDVREIIELGIRQKLAVARVKAAPEQKALAQWAKKVKKHYSKYLPAALRITKTDDGLQVIALQPEKLVIRGFGSYLENIVTGDVSMNQAAYDIFKKAPARSGIQIIEMFTQDVLGYTSTNVQVKGIPVNRISVQRDTDELFQKIVIQS